MKVSHLFLPLLGVLFVLSLFFSIFDQEGGLVTAIYTIDLIVIAAGLAYIIISQQLFAYVIRRLVDAFVSLWVIATVLFVMLRFLPGGPFDSDKALPPEVKANIEA